MAMYIRRLLCVFITLYSLTCFAQKGQTSVATISYPSFDAQGKIKNISKQQAIDIIGHNAYEKGVRYRIYIGIVTVLPTLAEDLSFLKPVLTKYKWDNIDWGNGNFERGPRFVNMQFVKDGTYCSVFRKYINGDKRKDGYYNLRLYEEFEFANKK